MTELTDEIAEAIGDLIAGRLDPVTFSQMWADFHNILIKGWVAENEEKAAEWINKNNILREGK